MANFDFIKLPYLGILGWNWKKLLSHSKSAPSSFSKCKVSC